MYAYGAVACATSAFHRHAAIAKKKYIMRKFIIKRWLKVSLAAILFTLYWTTRKQVGIGPLGCRL
ncbi:protein of unknown function [Paraburkholderia dioscoreae]|uniref:Uncharacterized protein n=1 Tax=Paraburkholderia dioscoreae TaxID=2604047 RepID=A0A5Q4ZBS3_9BURK|nr:protein of unknown function [Paraburkholderia dioscoreae]